MTEQPDTVENEGRRSLMHNWVEERASAALDAEQTKKEIQKQGHKGLLTVEEDSKMETITSYKDSFRPSKEERQRCIRTELLEQQIAYLISQKIEAEQNQPTPKIDFCSMTHREFCAEGFVPPGPETFLSSDHDYRTEEAITFWSENRHRVQGVTAAQSLKAPFRKSAKFSTPISERLDEIELDED